MKKNSLIVKLTSILLAFLFVASSLAPLLAAENSVQASENSASPVIETGEIPVISDSAAGAESSADKKDSSGQIVDLSALEKGSSDNTKNNKNKTKPKDDGLVMSASSLLGGTTEGSAKTQDKARLPQSETLTGALVYEYPIAVPPSRNNLQPDLKLAYNSQAGEEGSVAGYGWSFNIPYVERINRKGTDKLYTENYFNSSLSGELVLIGGISYGAKIENGEFLKYEFSNDSWLVTDKQGTKYKFGFASTARQDDPADSAKVFKWMLEEVRDTNDNFVRYEYFKDAGQIYPSKIFYTGSGAADGIFEIEFLRELRTDAAYNYKTGFSAKTDYRINEIQAKINSQWERKYSISYTTGDNTSRSIISSIVESGKDEAGIITTLPATGFEYKTSGYNDGWTEDATWQIPTDFVNYYDKSNDSDYSSPTRLADVNGDGLLDIVKSRLHHTVLVSGRYQEFNTSEVYLNNGHGWTLDTSWQVPLAFYYMGNSFISSSVEIADINGDGLPDLLRSLEDSGYGMQTTTGNTTMNVEKIVYLNNGHGWTEDATWQIPTDFVKYSDKSDDPQYSSPTRLADINGDGLLDIVKSKLHHTVLVSGRYQEFNTSEVYLNNGHGWTLDTSWQVPLAFYYTGNSFISSSVQIADINGDGLADLVRSLEDSGYGMQTTTGNTTMNVEKIVYLNNGPKQDLLTKIIYPQGGHTDISYKPTPQYLTGSGIANPNLPFVLDNVEKIISDDGLGNTSEKSYSYEGGKYYYSDPYDRKFSGFAKVSETDNAGNVTKTYFHQGDTTNSSQGEESDHVSKIGKPYRIETYDASNNLYSKFINKWENFDLGSGRNFVKLIQKIDSSYDGNSTHKDKAETYTYDNTTGNLTEKIQWGEVTGSDNGTFADTGTDKLSTSISYASNLTTNVIGLPSQETTLDQNNAKAKESKYYYDTLALGSADKGNLTKEEKWKSSTDYINSQKSYNSYGLVTQDTDPRGKVTTYTYDSYNLYPATVTNALAQATQYTYDYSSGKPKQTTDPNNFTFQTVYDGLDRVLEEKQPDLTAPSTLVTKSSYVYTDTVNAVSVKKTDYLDALTSVDSYSYFDGLGRVIQTREEAEDTNNFSVKDIVYNNRGLVQKESLPYFGSGSARTTPTVVEGLYSVYTYDPLARITSTVNAVGTITNAYDDWKVITTDAKGVAKDLYKDAYDRLVQVGEHGSTTLTTSYNYNGRGDLTKITDALGNIRNFTYDGLGQRLSAEDLHASADATFGTWNYTYDASGNLISQTDPKNQTVNYIYDGLNRQLSEDYTGAAGTDKTYSYDACLNGKGRLCRAAQLPIIVTNEYNPLGLVKKETKAIGAPSYNTLYDYDRQGNQTLMTNPDSSQVKNIYNSAGHLEQVQRKESTDADFINVVTDFDYSPLGMITYQADANGSVTTNTYDAAKLYRLSSKITTISGGAHAQDLTYSYDANGNITKIVDGSATNSAKTIDYTYDSLNRLLSATATGAVNGQNYSETYSYDAIGNITNKNSQVYTYAGTGYANPHAVTSIGSVNYTYDNNGNLLTSSDGLANTWSYNNLLTRSVIGTTTVNYYYDYSGQRVRYMVGSVSTYYPSKYYNFKGTEKTKHIFAAEQLIATISGTGAGAVMHTVATDHLTGSNVVTNSSGVIEELMDYYPYGEVRLNEKAGTFSEQRKYAGQEYDVDTGLSYMNARYYSSAAGRFISQDPAYLAVGDNAQLRQMTRMPLEGYLSDPQGFNSYAYARNNPLMYVDRTGNYIETAFDMAMFSLSARDFKETPSFWNGVAVLADGASLLLPIPAVVGAVRHGDEAVRFVRNADRIRVSSQNIIRFGLEYAKNLNFKMASRGWSQGRLGDGLGNLVDHYIKHGNEVGAKSVKEYYGKANSFIGSKGTYSFSDSLTNNGDIIHYNPGNHQKVITDSSGNIRSYYVENRANYQNMYNSIIKEK